MEKEYQLFDFESYKNELLHNGSKEVKDAATKQIKDYYDNNDFEQDDIYDIIVDTGKEDELFEYAGIDNYYSKNKDYGLEL